MEYVKRIVIVLTVCIGIALWPFGVRADTFQAVSATGDSETEVERWETAISVGLTDLDPNTDVLVVATFTSSILENSSKRADYYRLTDGSITSNTLQY